MSLTWRAVLSRSEELLLSLIEHAVFSTEFDDALRSHVKARRDVESLLGAAPLIGLVADIDEALTGEAAGGGAPRDDGADGGQGVGEDDGGAPADGEAPPDIVATAVAKLATKSDDEKQKIDGFVAQCWRKVDTYVDLFHETSDAAAATDRLKTSAANKLRIEKQPDDTRLRRFVLIVYDLKSAGEASSHPATRAPPLRGNGDHLKQCLRAALDAVGDAEIPDRDMYLIFDGGRPGLKPQLLSGFVAPDGGALPKSVRPPVLVRDEESHLSRFKNVRGFGHDLTETAYCVTAGVLEMPVKKRKIYPGTNRSNSIGPIGCPSFTSSAAHNVIAWKEKKDFYSASAKIACRVGGAAPPGSEELERKPETMEPANFHGYVSVFWEEILHSHSVVGVIDFTPGAGYLAEACLVEKIPYTGFVQTATGERVVRRYLFKRMRDLMCKPGSAHYDAALRNLLGADDAAAAAAAAAPRVAATGGGAPASAAPAPDGPAPKQTEAAGGANPALLQALKALSQPARKATAGKAHGTREDGKSKATKPKAKVEEIKDDDDDDADSASDPEV
mgnify:CR=1 FL=1